MNNARQIRQAKKTGATPGDAGSGRQPQPVRPGRKGRTKKFFIGGNNGVALIADPLLERGWERIEDSRSAEFDLKWVEIRRDIVFDDFRAGKQLLARNPGISVLTSKGKLNDALQTLEQSRLRRQGQKQHQNRQPAPTQQRGGVINKLAAKQHTRKQSKHFSPLPLGSFYFETHKLDDTKGLKAFRSQVTSRPEDVWICKPVGRNQGKGIFLVTDAQGFLDELDKEKEEQRKAARKPPAKPPMARIVQAYLRNPLLHHGRKADIRAYMLIAWNSPAIVLYHDGYVRLSVAQYSGDDFTDVSAHLTNQYVQKKSESYSSMQDDTTWTMDEFAAYMSSPEGRAAVNEEHRHLLDIDGIAEDAEGIPAATDDDDEREQPRGWVHAHLIPRMKEIMRHCYHAAIPVLDKRAGFFDLLGFDFIVDTHLNTWLIEVNVNPALHTRTRACKEVLPPMIRATLDIELALMTQHQSPPARRVTKLPTKEALAGFEVIVDGTTA